jgi:hypothetical protein
MEDIKNIKTCWYMGGKLTGEQIEWLIEQAELNENLTKSLQNIINRSLSLGEEILNKDKQTITEKEYLLFLDKLVKELER